MTQPLRGGVLSSVPDRFVARQIADALEETANNLAVDVEGAEQLMAHLPPTPGVTDSFNKLKHRAELVGIAHAYFQEISKHPETPVDIDDFAFRPIGPSPR